MKFENLRPDYLAINPKGVVPTLVHDVTIIPESSIINEYLDDAFPELALRPADARDRARMRLWVQHEEDELFIAVRPATLNLMMKQIIGRYSEEELDRLLANHPTPGKIGFLKKVFMAPFDEGAVEKSRHRLAAAFGRMDETLSRTPWLAGETYSLADIAAAPVIDRVERLGMADLWDDLPGMSDWIARLTARPAYKASQPPSEFRLPVAVAGSGPQKPVLSHQRAGTIVPPGKDEI